MDKHCIQEFVLLFPLGFNIYLKCNLCNLHLRNPYTHTHIHTRTQKTNVSLQFQKFGRK